VRSTSRAKAAMLRNLMLVAALLSLGAIPSQALARRSCSTAMYNRADSSLGRAGRSWPTLFRHQQVFGSCDDGALAEGYSDAVAKLFADRWDRFGQFEALSARHPAFRRWVIRHIDSSATEDDLKKIVRNTRSCRRDPNGKKLCASVRQAATKALTE